MIHVELRTGRVDHYPEAHAWHADEDGYLSVKAEIHGEKPSQSFATYAPGVWLRVGTFLDK